MRRHTSFVMLLVPLTLVANAVAGTMRPTPPTPLEHMRAVVKQGDPGGHMVFLVAEGETPHELTVVVHDAFHREHYQERLQFIQSLGRAWQKLTGTSRATVLVMDRGYNPVGGAGEWSGWASKY